jgi:23S rRNA pseudouridine2604 synthase
MVNGARPVLGVKVDDEDEVQVNGVSVRADKPAPILIAYHKPIGIITSVDPNAKDNILSQIEIKEKIFPIGRLDVASSGLILLTNDGSISEAITHPRYYHEKEYVVTVDRALRKGDLQTMRAGMVILGSMTKPATVTQEDEKVFRIILTEGRNRQIRRMCEGLGYEVRRLRRDRVVNIKLGELPVGSWRYLTEAEIESLKKEIKMA